MAIAFGSITWRWQSFWKITGQQVTWITERITYFDLVEIYLKNSLKEFFKLTCSNIIIAEIQKAGKFSGKIFLIGRESLNRYDLSMHYYIVFKSDNLETTLLCGKVYMIWTVISPLISDMWHLSQKHGFSAFPQNHPIMCKALLSNIEFPDSLGEIKTESSLL